MMRNVKERLATLVMAAMIAANMFTVTVYATDIELMTPDPEELVSGFDTMDENNIEDDLEVFSINQDYSVKYSWSQDDRPPILPLTDETTGEDLEEIAVLASSPEDLEAVGKKVLKYYNQPELPVVPSYDSIQFFIVEDGKYTGKAYFVISKNSISQNWMLYDYRQTTAETYFTKTEMYGTMYVPSKVNDSRKDDAATISIDEAKVPTMTRESFNGMYCNWRDFSDIPFIKVDGSLVYATYEVEEKDEEEKKDDDKKDDGKKDEEKEDEEKDTPSQDKPKNNGGSEDRATTPSANSSTSSKWYRYTVGLNNGNTYRVFVTRSVSYNGKKHVLNTTKSGKKKSNDVQVYVYLNGQKVDPKLYKVQFKNNINCNGYGNNEKSIPYFRLKFKFKNKSLKADIKAMKKKAFGFNITPLDISEGTISYKSVKNGRLKKATWSGSGITVKLNPPKGSKGDYTLTNEDGETVVVGKNNFVGELGIDSATPNNNSGGIY